LRRVGRAATAVLETKRASKRDATGIGVGGIGCGEVCRACGVSPVTVGVTVTVVVAVAPSRPARKRRGSSA
jgi:hypothetical protein